VTERVWPQHELLSLMQEAATVMASNYERIRARSRDDPGTAGDRGEEDWARLLRLWLPSGYHVETKGQLLFTKGQVSPQVDVVVLTPSYPRGLLGMKLYIAAGVAAAFECKNTLRTEHLRKTLKTSVRLGEFTRATDSQRPLFGLLSHAHDIPSKRRSAEDVLDEALNRVDREGSPTPATAWTFYASPISARGHCFGSQCLRNRRRKSPCHTWGLRRVHSLSSTRSSHTRIRSGVS
jgi:Domain of unknown function (DUF6602)